MAEPTSASAASGAGLAAALVALLGPAAGEYATILFAALAGSLWPLSRGAKLTRLQGALLVLRLVATSTALTGLVAWLVHRHAGVPMATLLAPVAFGIAVIGDAWPSLFAAAVERLRGVIRGGRRSPPQ